MPHAAMSSPISKTPSSPLLKKMKLKATPVMSLEEIDKIKDRDEKYAQLDRVLAAKNKDWANAQQMLNILEDEEIEELI